MGLFKAAIIIELKYSVYIIILKEFFIVKKFEMTFDSNNKKL